MHPTNVVHNQILLLVHLSTQLGLEKNTNDRILNHHAVSRVRTMEPQQGWRATMHVSLLRNAVRVLLISQRNRHKCKYRMCCIQEMAKLFKGEIVCGPELLCFT